VLGLNNDGAYKITDIFDGQIIGVMYQEHILTGQIINQYRELLAQ
jgi:hypothetical protein